jgi:SPP1 gp7 family putative phage head morphogenesis protein
MNPILPGTPADRTGTLPILRRVVREINRRWAGLQADVLAIFDAIPVYAINAGETVDMFRYGLTAEQMQRLSTELQAAVERWIADGRDPANLFWWSQYVAETQQLGTAQTVANLGNLSPAYAAARSIEMVIYSEPYVQRMAMAQIKSYEHWTGLAAQQKSELAQVIGQAVVDGRNPRAVAKTIEERLVVSESKAKQFAQTDVTDTLRQARWAEAEQAQQDFGIRIGLLWTSALLSTTRPWHASRHGRIYTAAEVKAFYSRNGEKYNCHCSTTEALLDADGKPILTPKLRAKMAGEKLKWDADNPA